MSEWPPDFRRADFDEDDIDMGEPVTDKLNLLLEELPEDSDEEAEVDLGEPVTGKLHLLFDDPPSEDFGARVSRAVERRRLAEDVSKWSLRGMAFGLLELAKAVFGGTRGAGGDKS